MIKGKKAQVDFISEALESPGFWILGGGGCIAVTIGWIVSNKMEFALPFWIYLVLMVTVLIAAAGFGRE